MRIRASPWIIACVALAACFDAREEAGVVGPAGGRIDQGDVSLIVPAGALSSSVRIDVVASDASPPAGYRAIGGAVRLSPEGLSFAQPVRLVLPTREQPPFAKVATRPLRRDAFELLSADWPAANRVQTEVQHFSIFIPVTPDDAGVDGGIDAGVPADGPLERCQRLDGGAIAWSTIAGTGDVDLVVAANMLVLERPSGYVFSVGQTAYSVDRQLGRIDQRRTFDDTPLGGWNGLNGFVLGDEVVLNAARNDKGGVVNYAEWRIGADGRFELSPDGGGLARLRQDWTYNAGSGLTSQGPGSTVLRRRQVLSVAAGAWFEPSLAQLPYELSASAIQTRLPVGYSDSSAGVELPDGSVVFALGAYLPSFAMPVEVRVDLHAVSADGGLTKLGDSLTKLTQPILAAGGRAGFTWVYVDWGQLTFYEPGATGVGVTFPLLSGQIVPAYDPVRTQHDGGLLVLSRFGDERAPTQDLYLTRFPPGERFLLQPGLAADAPPGFGALRDDSFVVAWHDADGIHAARLCLPP